MIFIIFICYLTFVVKDIDNVFLFFVINHYGHQIFMSLIMIFIFV